MTSQETAISPTDPMLQPSDERHGDILQWTRSTLEHVRGMSTEEQRGIGILIVTAVVIALSLPMENPKNREIAITVAQIIIILSGMVALPTAIVLGYGTILADIVASIRNKD